MTRKELVPILSEIVKILSCYSTSPYKAIKKAISMLNNLIETLKT